MKGDVGLKRNREVDLDKGREADLARIKEEIVREVREEVFFTFTFISVNIPSFEIFRALLLTFTSFFRC